MAWKKAYVWNGTAWDAIGNQAVATLDDYALLSPQIEQTITNTIADGFYLISPTEKTTISASASSSTVNFDVLDQAVLYNSASATEDFTLNIRGDASTTLDSVMNVGESRTINFLNTNGASGYYATTYQIDENTIVPKWMYNSAPSAGNANSIDIYNITIIKTSETPTYLVLASMVNFS